MLIVASVLASRKDASPPSRKPAKDIIDPELAKLIPSSDPDVAHLASLADAPLDIGDAAEVEGGAEEGSIEESPTRPSGRRGPSDKRKGKEPSYKAIVVEDTPGGWGFGWGDDADIGEPLLTYHGYGGVKLHGWKHGEDDSEDHHGWKDDMDHHHVKKTILIMFFYVLCILRLISIFNEFCS